MSFLTGLEHFVRQDEPLSSLTWLRVGGAAEYFAEPTSVDDLVTLVRRCREHETPIRVLGGGSNVLVRDEGVRGVVAQLGAAAFGEISVRGNVVKAGAGAKLGHVISASIREGLAGLEMLVAIPGTIGGALRGNAGSHGGDIGQWTVEATVLGRDGEVRRMSREEIVFGYRDSNFDGLVILAAEMRLEPDEPDQLTKRMQKQWIAKKAHQPLAHEHTGCIFKNPGEMSAGALIDQAGLKETRVGGAAISPRHANFLITDRGASSADVIKLIEQVRQQVFDRTGVELKLQIDIW